MPTPLEILLDPISLVAIALYAALISIEAVAPARRLPRVSGWALRGLASFAIYFYLSSYLPLWWDRVLADYRLFDLSSLGAWTGGGLGVLIYEVALYCWHRLIHSQQMLFRAFHQMHHSAERLDTFGAFYFSPLDMVGFTLVGSLSVVWMVGLAPEAGTVFLLSTFFLGVFQHTNIKTPRWLGYIIQRPESHSVHHGRGVHAYNYSDLPIVDVVFGTFRNPARFHAESGFFHGASSCVGSMLRWADVASSAKVSSEERSL